MDEFNIWVHTCGWQDYQMVSDLSWYNHLPLKCDKTHDCLTCRLWQGDETFSLFPWGLFQVLPGGGVGVRTQASKLIPRVLTTSTTAHPTPEQERLKANPFVKYSTVFSLQV